MAFIKEETEDMRISEPFRMTHKDVEKQTGWFSNVNSVICLLLNCWHLNACDNFGKKAE